MARYGGSLTVPGGRRYLVCSHSDGQNVWSTKNKQNEAQSKKFEFIFVINEK